MIYDERPEMTLNFLEFKRIKGAEIEDFTAEYLLKKVREMSLAEMGITLPSLRNASITSESALQIIIFGVNIQSNWI